MQQFLPNTANLTTTAPAPDGGAAAEPQSETLARRRWRIWLLAGFLFVLGFIVMIRLLDYQLLNRETLLDPTRLQLTQSPRGTIVDRDGEIMAADRFYYQVVATANEIKTSESRQLVSEQLAATLGLPAIETFNILVENAQRPYAELAKQVELDAGRRLLDVIAQAEAGDATTPLQYISVRPVPRRFYPQGALGSHIIGFVQADHYGLYGLEEYYDTYLDADGVGLLEQGETTLASLPYRTRRFLPSVVGKDLVLTLDRSIQYIIEEELQEAIAKYRAQGGAMIVMEPKSGAILGMANWPTYNPNTRNSENVDFGRFLNPSVSALYEPGSVFKIVTMAAGLDTHTITPTTIYTDSGYIVVGQRTIYNSNRTAAGPVSVTEALARSLNVVTAQVAEQVGSKDFYRYVRRFGFGERTGVDLADEVAGLLKKPGDELWSQSDLGTNSFGQGLAVTPLQMINATAAIANGGMLTRPYVVQARIQGDMLLETRPTIIQRAISPQAAADLTEMMIATVDIGNKAARVNGYEIAGKSGTAQIPSPDGYLEDQTIVTFVGFAPARDPAFVLLVKLDRPDPAISQWAGYTAAPVFAQVSRRLFEHLNIAPDALRTQTALQAAAEDAAVTIQ
jgi:cell division protein FtsI/penicillin-binding protein 2